MRTSTFLLSVLFCLFSMLSPAQNYLRVADPDAWGAPASNQPNWYINYPRGQFDEVTITVEPQGIFTEISVYATISQGTEAWSWNGDYEIIWQFDLPENTIVHDAWLWVGQDIIKADVVDFWTALATYTGVVDYNQDPLFFYQMSDKRYEVRVYPLLEGESRRLKLSFLVPAVWHSQTVTQQLLHNMFASTPHFPPHVEIRVPVNNEWGTPTLVLDNATIPMINLITGGSGNVLHSLSVGGEEFAEASQAYLYFEAPYSGQNNQSFARTYSDAGENYYQLVYYPHWEDIVQNASAKKSLILLDYDPDKSSLSKVTLTNLLEQVFTDHFSPADAVNVAVATTGGIQFLSNSWWNFSDAAFPDALANMLDAIDTDNLPLLLTEGFAWAQAQGDVSHIYLLAANEDYFYPPVADDVFAGISQSIPADIPLTVVDYQNTDVSVIFYNSEEYEGNEYFYQLLAGSVNEFDMIVFRESVGSFILFCQQVFALPVLPEGIMDLNTSLSTGISYQRYDLHDLEVTSENNGIIMQTGKYLGGFPMVLHAGFIADNGEFWSLTDSVMPEPAPAGDTLMREIWQGLHLKKLESQIGSNEDREELIDLSKQERVLTGLTAFLALEPSLGGEPCIDCLYNDGGSQINSTQESFNIAKAQLNITPNPGSSVATIELTYPDHLESRDWTAAIFDTNGRMLTDLGKATALPGSLKWQWNIGSGVQAGLYVCKVSSEYGELMGKIAVVR